MNRRIAVLGLALLLAAAADAQTGPQRFEGNMISMQGAGARSTAFFTLQVDRWGTKEEAAAYLQILKDQGQPKLIEAFFDAEPVGFIKIGASLGYQIAFVRELPQADGSRIVRAFTDRPIQFAEVMLNTRSHEYPIGIIELKMPAGDKKGEGTVVVAAAAHFDKDGELVIEQLGAQPLRVLNVKMKAVKEKK